MIHFLEAVRVIEIPRINSAWFRVFAPNDGYIEPCGVYRIFFPKLQKKAHVTEMSHGLVLRRSVMPETEMTEQADQATACIPSHTKKVTYLAQVYQVVKLCLVLREIPHLENC